MKKSTLSRSKLYNPKRKTGVWTEGLKTLSNTLRHPAIIIGAIVAIVYLTRFSGGDRIETGKRLHTNSDRDVIVLNLDDVQAATCAKHAQLVNFTTKEYQVGLIN